MGSSPTPQAGRAKTAGVRRHTGAGRGPGTAGHCVAKGDGTEHTFHPSAFLSQQSFTENPLISVVHAHPFSLAAESSSDVDYHNSSSHSTSQLGPVRLPPHSLPEGQTLGHTPPTSSVSLGGASHLSPVLLQSLPN